MNSCCCPYNVVSLHCHGLAHTKVPATAIRYIMPFTFACIILLRQNYTNIDIAVLSCKKKILRCYIHHDLGTVSVLSFNFMVYGYEILQKPLVVAIWKYCLTSGVNIILKIKILLVSVTTPILEIKQEYKDAVLPIQVLSIWILGNASFWSVT